jgi:hypothetical protein
VRIPRITREEDGMIHTDGKNTIANDQRAAFEVIGEAIAVIAEDERVRLERVRRENEHAARVCGCPSCKRLAEEDPMSRMDYIADENA